MRKLDTFPDLQKDESSKYQNQNHRPISQSGQGVGRSVEKGQ